MRKEMPTETVVAIATPIGEGGLAVLRISGPTALDVASQGFRGNTDLKLAASHTAHLGEFVSPKGDVLDQVVGVVFRKPSSYTGEDVVEISCHGGLLVTQRVLQALLDYGATQAAPGEFTKRAFLNGKIDLSQAEAVAELIHARSDRALRNSLHQLKGDLAVRIGQLREGLIRTTGMLELELDFAEEGLEFADKPAVGRQIRESIGRIHGLLETYRSGRFYRDGVKVVLAGMPNVGKSSILNALLRENRAIVTEIPGTTRDTIEEALTINGLMFRVVDTAGLREAVDRVEQEGVRRSKDQINSSDLLVVILDGSRPIERDEISLAARLIRDLRGQAPAVVVLNKTDLGSGSNGSLRTELGSLAPDAIVKTSAVTGEGIELLKETFYKAALTGGHDLQESSLTVTNARHYDALKRAAASLELAFESIESGKSGEFVTVDLRAALDTLGEITGAVTTDDILNEIFSKFCIGK